MDDVRGLLESESGANDYYIIGLEPGVEGVSKGVGYEKRISERTSRFIQGVVPTFLREEIEHDPTFTGLKPLGDRYSKEMADWLYSDFPTLKYVPFEQIRNGNVGDIKGRTVVINDSVFFPENADYLANVKRNIIGSGARRVLYIVEYGPFGNPLVDFVLPKD